MGFSQFDKVLVATLTHVTLRLEICFFTGFDTPRFRFLSGLILPRVRTGCLPHFHPLSSPKTGNIVCKWLEQCTQLFFCI